MKRMAYKLILVKRQSSLSGYEFDVAFTVTELASCSDTVGSNGSDINSFPSGKKMHLIHCETFVCFTGPSRNSEKCFTM